MRDAVLEEIRRVRSRNNDVWMELVGLAMKHAPPEEFNRVMAQIEENDRQINGLWKCLRKSAD